MMTIKCQNKFCDFRDTQECVDNAFGSLRSNMCRNNEIQNKEDAENPFKE